MVPRPHLVTFRRVNTPVEAAASDVRVEFRDKLGPRGLSGNTLDHAGEGEGPARFPRGGNALLLAIVVVEAIVFLAIVTTSVQGPANLAPSAWVFAGLSFLFLILSRLRRWATTRLWAD